MDYSICSRETERDYTWDNSHASHLVAECAQAKFAPAFEGSITTSRFVAFLRCTDSLSGVVLCVSASTKRIDFRHRPIRTMAFLRAENPDETKLLAAFFAECLRKRDEETLYNADSGVAKAVESLYKRKNADEFVRFCKALQLVSGNGSAPKKRVAFPRSKDEGERQVLANALSAVIADDSPFLFVLTDRLPTDVLGSLGSMFDHAVVRIFSKAVEHAEQLPEPASQKHRWAAAIGGAAILAIIAAAIGPCSRSGEEDKTNASTGREVVTTNTPASAGTSNTNLVQVEGRSRELVGEARQNSSSTNAVQPDAETSASAITLPVNKTGVILNKENQ